MTDYIKREDAINTIRNTYTGMTSDTLELRINDIPSADVAPVRHGRWVQRKIRESQFVQNGYTRLYCSVCGEYSEVESNYCGNCGAKMDE